MCKKNWPPEAMARAVRVALRDQWVPPAPCGRSTGLEITVLRWWCGSGSEFAAQGNASDLDLWMLLSSGEGFVADDGEGTAEVCVQLMFDVLPWALLRFLPSALPPALMASAHLCHSPCTQTQAREIVQPVCQGDIGEIKI